MTQYLKPRTPYDAFVLRAWRAAQLTGTEQYILLDTDKRPDPHWCDSPLRFSMTTMTLPSKAPFPTAAGSFCDLGELPRSINQEDFSALLRTLVPFLTTGSSLLFCYSSKTYSYHDMERLLSSVGCLIYEHLDEEDIRSQFLVELATARPQRSIRNLCYCLAVKHRNTAN